MYTDDEVQAAVEKLLRSSIRRPFDALGVRRYDVSFNDIQEAAASVFLLYPEAPYYVVGLGVQRLRDLILATRSVLSELVNAVVVCGRSTTPVKDVTSLADAGAALVELETASSLRDKNFKDISRVPAYQRFDANVQKFLTQSASNLRVAGDISATPQEARTKLPSLTAALKESWAEVVRRASLTSTALEDYAAVSLPSLVASGVISRARAVLSEHASALAAMSESDRLVALRDTTLDVLAARALVRAFGSFSGPSPFRSTSGTLTPYSSETLLGEPATLQGTLVNHYAVTASTADLVVTADGGSPSTVSLPASPMAVLTGSITETDGTPNAGFLIGDGGVPVMLPGYATPNNNSLTVLIDGVAYVCALSPSPTSTQLRSVDSVCSDINTYLPATVRAEPYFPVLVYAGQLDIPAGLNPVATVPGGATDLIELGLKPDDLVVVSSGANAGLWPVLAVSPTTVQLSGTAVLQTGAPCEAGPKLRALRIRCIDPNTQLAAQTSISVLADTTASANACTTFGLYAGISATCRPSLATEVVDAINNQDSPADAYLVDTAVVAGDARSSPLDPFNVTFVSLGGTGDVSYVGTTLTLVPSTPIDPTGLVGQVVTLRTGPNPNKYGTITAASSGSITATVGLAGSDATGVSYEVGPTVNAQDFQTVEVTSGPNTGFYLAAGPGATPLDVRLRTALALSGPVRPVTFTARVLNRSVGLRSRSQQVNSALSVSGTALSLLFATPPGTAHGTTSHVQLEFLPRSVSVNDVLELYDQSYRIPASTHTVTGVDVANMRLTVDPPVQANVTWVFAEQPPPFARIRVGNSYDYSALQSGVTTSLASPPFQDTFFSELSALMNPLRVNTNPTASQVGTAKSKLLELDAALSSLDAVLSSYKATPMASVDALLRSYKEKGVTRATDLLLEGQFQTFFDLTVDGSSYAGAMQEAMRAVARTDLPVSKLSRDTGSYSKASVPSPDYEFTREDTEADIKPDAPADGGDNPA